MPNFAADSRATGSASKPLERSSLGSFGYIAVSPHLRTTWIFPLIIPSYYPYPPRTRYKWRVLIHWAHFECDSENLDSEDM